MISEHKINLLVLLLLITNDDLTSRQHGTSFQIKGMASSFKLNNRKHFIVIFIEIRKLYKIPA